MSKWKATVTTTTSPDLPTTYEVAIYDEAKGIVGRFPMENNHSEAEKCADFFNKWFDYLKKD